VIKKILKNQHGLTAVELAITMTLIGIVLGLGYLYFDFGYRAFQRGERMAIAQQSVRGSADFMVSELRYAAQITINPGSMPAGFSYFYLQDGSLIFRDGSGAERILANSDQDQIAYGVSFSREGVTNVVQFTVTADGDFYELTTSVQALNLTQEEDFVVNAGNGTVIQYRKPY
jgi:prepilin-type N-terminal cleavage/methylation domain-containing protein